MTRPGDFLPHVKMMDTCFTDAELMKQFGFRYALIRKPRPYDTTTLNYNWQIWETKAFSVYSNATDRIDEASAQEVTDDRSRRGDLCGLGGRADRGDRFEEF